MRITDDEALACLKVLVAMAKADGTLKSDEKKSLEVAIQGFELPTATSLDDLLRGEIDVAAALAKIASPDAREQLYRSAHFVANADGVSAPEERALLAEIEAATAPSEELRARLAQLAPPPSRRALWVESLRGFFRPKA